MNELSKVDHSVLRTNQALIITLLVLAFVLNLPVLVGVTAFFMLLGSLALRKAGFFWVYTRVLRPLNLVRPDVVQDHPEPHLFAQGMGGSVLVGSLAALLLGAAPLGWGLSWLVVALASLNLFGGFCVGCFIYYWLNRLNVPGFARSVPEGSIPGFRPKAAAQEVSRVRK